MTKFRFILFVVLLFKSVGLEGVTKLIEGESALASFQYMSSTPTVGWSIGYGEDHLGIGESYRFRVYEDSLFEMPLLDFTVNSSSDSHGFGFIGYDNEGYFPDFQGIVRIDLISGTLDLSRVSLATELNGFKYRASMDTFSVVPEPSYLPFLAMLIPCSLMLNLKMKNNGKFRQC